MKCAISKKYISISLLVILLFTNVLLATSCEAESIRLFTDISHFGSALKISVFTTDDRFNNAVDDVKEFLNTLSRITDDTVRDSDLAKFNSAVDGEEIEVDKHIYELFKISETAYDLTEGAYDPTAYYLVDLWGFSHSGDEGKTAEERIPDESLIKSFACLTDFSKIEGKETDGKFFIKKDNTACDIGGTVYYAKLDFGGIIKGYAVEKIKEILISNGITKGNVIYGSSSLCLLDSFEKDNWTLKLTNPLKTDGAETYCNVYVKNADVATSGDYERFFEYNGKRYCHIIDGKTGYPIDNGVSSVTVISGSAALADALATGLCVAGKEKILNFKEDSGLSDIDVIATFADGETLKVFSTVNDIDITNGERYEKKSV